LIIKIRFIAWTKLSVTLLNLVVSVQAVSVVTEAGKITEDKRDWDKGEKLESVKNCKGERKGKNWELSRKSLLSLTINNYNIAK